MVSYDPNEGIPTVVEDTLNALKAAAASSVKRFVLTPSSTAALSPKPEIEFGADESTWNEKALKAARAPPPHEGKQCRLDVYSASKM